MTMRWLRPAAAGWIVAAVLATGRPMSAEETAPPPEDAGIQEVKTLLRNGRPAEAEAQARRLLHAEGPGASDSLRLAGIVELLAEALWRGGKTKDPEALDLARRALRMRESLQGPAHADVAKSLDNIGKIFQKRGEFEDARQTLERSLDIRRKALGPEHPLVARSMSQLADVLSWLGKKNEAKALVEKALASREKALGPDHRDTAPNYTSLAIFHFEDGDFPAALALFEKSLRISEKSFGPDHPTVANAHYNVGTAYEEMGDVEAARASYERAVAIREKSLGPDHPALAMSLGGLGRMMRNRGDYAGARALYERALSIQEKALGPDHLEISWRLNDLGILAGLMGDDERMEDYLTRSLEIVESRLGPRHPEVAAGVNNLATVMVDRGDYPRGLELHRRALEMRRQAGGPDHPDVAESLANLAEVHKLTGDADGALGLYEEALSIMEKGSASRHPKVASLLSSLGKLEAALGRNREARARFARALALRQSAYGGGHPATGESRAHLAVIDLADGRTAEALRNAIGAEAIMRSHFRRTARTLPEREAILFRSWRPYGVDTALSALPGAGASRDGSRAEAIWNEIVQSRALVVDELADRHRVAAGASDPGMTDRAESLARARNRLAALVVRGPDAKRPEAFPAAFKAAQDAVDAAERAVAERSMPLRARRGEGGPGLSDVRRALPDGSALVAFVQYERMTAAPDAAHPIPSWPRTGTAYAAFVMRAGGQRVDAVHLGSAGDIDGLIRRWRASVAAPPAVPALQVGGRDTGARTEGQTLREILWDPVAVGLRGARQVFVVPDGSIHLVNFAALPAAGDGYLLETAPTLHYLSAERDLSRRRPPTGRGFLVLGGPDFDARAEDAPDDETRAASRPAGAAAAGRRMRSAGNGGFDRCGALRSLRFDPLPEAAAEVDAVLRAWNGAAGGGARDDRIVALTGARASEGNFKRLASGFRVVHVATHGFLMQESCRPEPERAGTGQDAERSAAAPAGNPLLLSGLALAGANRRDEAENGAGEDGMLLAEEIAGLDLTGAEWVVLSACETGMGRPVAGEGLLGLKRAFEVAGAGTLILSLWPVGDAAARDWMQWLYEGRRAGLPTAEAVRHAALRVLRERRERGRSTHPFYWAAFVASGDWR